MVLGTVACAGNPGNPAGGSPKLEDCGCPGHTTLQSEFQASLGYRLRPGLKNPKAKQRPNQPTKHIKTNNSTI